MKIAIDARIISATHPTGIEKAILRLPENLPETRHEIFLFTNKKISSSIRNVTVLSSRVRNDGIWFHFVLPFLLHKHKINWFLSPVTQLPKILPRKIKTCVFVYDLAYKHFPEEYDPQSLKTLLSRTGPSIRRSDRIITISHSAKKDVEKFFPEYTGPVDVVPLACDDATNAQPINNPDLNPDAILMIGTGYGRKNFQILGPVLSLLKTKHNLSPHVNIAGKLSENLEKVLSALPSDIRSQITHLGFISDGQKNWLLSTSSMLFFPSLNEGFGIPVLEAMMSHCPVVCSNTSSLPEIVADAALTVNPKSPEECADAIAKILMDKGFRQNLITKGDARVKNFSWAKSARILADILEQLT